MPKFLTILLSLSPPAGIGMVIAQAVTGDAFGASGWASFGIAGLVLSWLLLKHLPSKDAQLERLISSSDERFTTMLETVEEQKIKLSDQHNVREKEQRQDFKDALQIVLKQSESMVVGVQGTLKDEMLRMRDALHGLRSTVSEVSGKVQIIEHRESDKNKE